MAHETPGKLIAITAVMMVLPIFIILRLLYRRKRGVQLGADDYTVIVSFVLSHGRIWLHGHARLTLRRSSCSLRVL